MTAPTRIVMRNPLRSTDHPLPVRASGYSNSLAQVAIRWAHAAVC